MRIPRSDVSPKEKPILAARESSEGMGGSPGFGCGVAVFLLAFLAALSLSLSLSAELLPPLTRGATVVMIGPLEAAAAGVVVRGDAVPVVFAAGVTTTAGDTAPRGERGLSAEPAAGGLSNKLKTEPLPAASFLRIVSPGFRRTVLYVFIVRIVPPKERALAESPFTQG